MSDKSDQLPTCVCAKATEIEDMHTDIKAIKSALIGDDYREGIIHRGERTTKRLVILERVVYIGMGIVLAAEAVFRLLLPWLDGR